MLQGEDHQRLPQRPHENRRRILHEKEQLLDLQQMQVRVESLHLGKIAVGYRQREALGYEMQRKVPLDDQAGYKNSSVRLQYQRH